ncbi:MAG: PdxA family dehydrogenase, partial [Usitatibacter sp.]
MALTAGEPAGIGPDLCALLAREKFPGRLVMVGDPRVIAQRAAARGIPFDVPAYRDRASAPAVSVLDVPALAPVAPGKLDPANAPHVLAILDRALDGCVAGEFDAMVTAPVQKSVLNDAGIPFTGHTEYLAQRTSTPLVVMLLVGGGLRVALATTHLALSEVPRAITRERSAITRRSPRMTTRPAKRRAATRAQRSGPMPAGSPAVSATRGAESGT